MGKSARQQRGRTRRTLASLGLMHRFQAAARAGGTTATFAGHAQIPPQVFQRQGATQGGFTNLAVGHCEADANVHEIALFKKSLMQVILI